MAEKLKLSEQLSIPHDAATQTFAIMGIRGTGKTTVAVDMAEEFSKIGQPFVVYDPTGAWSGIKSSRDGKRPGYPVVIFGGERADVPLEETAGETVAKVIVERRVPAILDCSLMRKGARIRFMADFCENLYHLNREALHFFADEAHTIAPQKPQPETARLLGAVEDIVLQGRRRGLGITVISQRPALVNTNIRTQCGTLITLRVIGPHDRKAIQEWTDAHGTPEQAKELMASLPTLKVGEGWVWSPAWLNIFKRVHFRDRETFDSSATPEVGKKAVTPKAVAEIDLAALGEQIMATVEAKKANDPAALKKKIADLQRQLATRPEAKAPEPKIIEKPVLKEGQLTRIEKLTQTLITKHDKLVTDLFNGIGTLNEGVIAAARELRLTIQPAFSPPPVVKKPAPIIRETRPTVSQPRPVVDGVEVTKYERKLLEALLDRYPLFISRSQLGILAHCSTRSSAFSPNVSSLIEKGFAEEDKNGALAATEGAATACPDYQPAPKSGEAARKYWLKALPKYESSLLSVLCENRGTMTLGEIAVAAERSMTSSAFRPAIKNLVELHLATEEDSGVKAGDELFD